MPDTVEQAGALPPEPRKRYSPWIKLLAVLVVLSGALVAAYAALSYDQIGLALRSHDYAQSDEYLNQLAQVSFNVRSIAFVSVDDENKTFAQKENEIETTYNQKIEKADADYQARLDQLKNENEQSVEGELTPKQKAEQQHKQAIDAAYQWYSDAKQTNEAQRTAKLERSQIASAALTGMKGVQYAISGGPDGVFTNVQGSNNLVQYFMALPHSVIYSNNQLLAGSPQYGRYGAVLPTENNTMYLGFTAQRYAELEADYTRRYQEGTVALRQCVWGLFAVLAGLAWLLYAAGRKPVLASVALLPSDHVLLDVQLALYALVFTLCFFGAMGMGNELRPEMASTMNRGILLVAYDACVSLGVLLGILFLTSVSKRAKRGEFLRYTLLYRIFRGIGRFLRNLVMGLKASTRFIWSFVIYAAGMFFLSYLIGDSRGSLAAALVFVVLVVWTISFFSYYVRKAANFRNLLIAVRRIQAGELGVRVPTGGGREFTQLAGSINNIADGLKSAVESEVKAERMRAELVTNVSHDLKTPLTSIVTYVDLLKTEGLTSENAAHYLDVIDQKAARLRTLTADLFEAAKASSGTMPVNLERVDANALLAQGLSELSDRIVASGLDMKLQLPPERLVLRADGRLLWRVMENLLSNVFKYALAGSRVYLSAARVGNRGVLTLKNISAYELNIPPEELTERFTRGDASRHSEGSGLGLSIARSLTELQGGEFRLEIDGDLFKAVVSLPVWEG